MSTFLKVKQSVTKDMEGRNCHTAESWATILLNNTQRLTDPVEQEKFWKWLVNPEEEDHLPPPELKPYDHKEEQIVEFQGSILGSDIDEEEKTEEVTYTQTYKKNGFASFILTKPKTETETSLVLPSDQDQLLLD